MKFSDVYKSEMDNITVSETSLDKLNTYSKKITDKKSNIRKMKFIKTAVAAVCTIALLTTVYANRVVLAQSLFGSFIFEMGGKQVEMGEIKPIKFNIDAFKACEGVHKVDGSDAYWKVYSCLDDLEKETGIVLIKSPLLEPAKLPDEEEYRGIAIDIWPKGFGHLDCGFMYGKYVFNVSGEFTCDGYKKGKSGYGYGLGTGMVYDFTYKSSNGIKVYFASVDQQDIRVFYLQAGNLMYQISSDAPVEDLKRLIDTFELR